MSASFLRAADLRTADLADSDTHHATATTVGCLVTLYELPHTLIEQVGALLCAVSGLGVASGICRLLHSLQDNAVETRKRRLKLSVPSPVGTDPWLSIFQFAEMVDLHATERHPAPSPLRASRGLLARRPAVQHAT